VIQRIERYYFPDSSGREVFIAYSLGNYISNQRDRYKDGGMMVSIDLLKHNNVVSIDNSSYYLDWVYTPIEKGRKQYYILPVAEFEKQPRLIDTLSYQKMMLYAADSRSLMEKENRGVKESLFDMETNLWNVK
jgi:poly-gamma-glutamate synthesis protein (capsule biosynthesis protein)